MIIGIPDDFVVETVLLTSESIRTLREAGHEVLLGRIVAMRPGFTEEDLGKAGATVSTAVPIYKKADIILKGGEPESYEYQMFRKGQVVMGFLNLASNAELVHELARRGARAIDLEAVQTPDRAFPVLEAVYEISGNVAVHIGAQYLQKWRGGRGVLLGGVDGILPANVVIVGSGTGGVHAARLASDLGAHVTVLEPDRARVKQLQESFGAGVEVQECSRSSTEQAVKEADLLIGAVHPGDREPPVLVTGEMVKRMKRYSVIVDIAPEHGSCIETMDRVVRNPPAFLKHDVVHYSVPYIYRQVPRLASLVLSKVVLPYVLELADKGFERAVRENPILARGVCVWGGKVTNRRLADVHKFRYTPLGRVVNLVN